VHRGTRGWPDPALGLLRAETRARRVYGPSHTRTADASVRRSSAVVETVDRSGQTYWCTVLSICARAFLARFSASFNDD
ncbi:hypothetical protein, partial [Rhodococcoides corynebacterioides]|uniref:hypothetical protein n=1 Tax=Rhodococcoides corynebacterioides TaxID=53972 RepID=UPI001B809B25